MKFHRLTFYAAIAITIAMFIVAILFYYANQYFLHTELLIGTLLFSLLIMLALNYLVLDFLFSYYGKKQIQRISTILPTELIQENRESMSFTTLGERVSELQVRNATEIDTMKEMEIFRKEYVGNVSHELKTPLFSIQGYVETLMDGGVENLSIRDKYLHRIGQSVERLLSIVQDLDAISQYESGEITLNFSVFDINAVAKDALDLLDLEAEKKGAKMQLLSSSPVLKVHADKQRISQVLVNLISNAVYYSNRENAVVIVHTKEQNGHVLVEVEDNGMGIKRDALPRIFERFYRVESSRSRREGGSGLGLAIVKHIMEAHKEPITVKSEYLEGTKFSFTLRKPIK